MSRVPMVTLDCLDDLFINVGFSSFPNVGPFHSGSYNNTVADTALQL